MKRNRFMKLLATGIFTPFISSVACSSKSKKKESNSVVLKESSDKKQLQEKSIAQPDTFNSIADLRSSTPNSLRETTDYQIKLLGYYEPNDGGGGIFYWDADAKEADDRGTVIKPDKFSEAGRWKRVVNEDQINVKNFGAVGDGSGIDDQPAIQKAINYAAEENIDCVFIPSGDYTLGLNLKEIRATALILKDNTHLKMASDTILRLPKDSNEVKYNTLSVVARENVVIEGGTVIGNKAYGKGDPQEQSGFGILLSVAQNVTIRNTVLREHWGDGIYVGRYGGGGAKCVDITIIDTVCDNNRRQGMSVISVKGLRVENCEFNNTGGVKPEAGIDFEPNNPGEVLQDISLKNIKCLDNKGVGILFVLSNLESPDNPKITIEVENAHIENSGKLGIAITKHFNVSGRGYINFEDITVKNNGSRAAYYVRNWHKDAPRITFENIVAINPNTCGQGGTTQGSALVFFDNDPGYAKGNLHVNGYVVKNDSSAKSKAPKDIYVDRNLWNCSFRNINSGAKELHNLHLLDKKKNNELDGNLLNTLNRK